MIADVFKQIFKSILFFCILSACSCAQLDVTETIYINNDKTGSYELKADFAQHLNESADILFEIDSIGNTFFNDGNGNVKKPSKNRQQYYEEVLHDFIKDIKQTKAQIDEGISLLKKINWITNIKVVYPTRNNLQQKVSFIFNKEEWQSAQGLRSVGDFKYKTVENKVILSNGGLDKEMIKTIHETNVSDVMDVELLVNYTIEYCFQRNISGVVNRIAGDSVMDNCYKNTFRISDSTFKDLSNLGTVTIYLK